MPMQANSAGTDNSGDSAPQEPTTVTSQEGAQASQGGGTPTPSVPVPDAPNPLSGTWFQDDDPRILIRWTLNQAQTSPTASPSEPATYQAEVWIYQLIFDATFPTQQTRGPVVPFSVVDPTVGRTPFLQGSLALSQNPPTLEVMNLRFPGFQSKSLPLYSPASSAPEPPASGTSTASSAQADTDETTTEGTPEA